MTKKVKISFLILVWSIVAVQIFVNYQQKAQKQQEVKTAFAEVESQIIDETISGYGYLGRLDLSDSMREKMLRNLADKMEIGDNAAFERSSGDNYEKMMLDCSKGVAKFTLQLVSMDSSEGPEEQYILINISTKDSVSQGKAYYDLVQRIYEEIGVHGTVNLEIMLERQGNLTLEAEEKTSELLEQLDAVKVDTADENGSYAVYGYRKSEDSYLMHNGEKTNLQLVMAYDEKQDKTYVKIGIPMVNSSY